MRGRGHCEFHDFFFIFLYIKNNDNGIKIAQKISKEN